jgi:hypothetical protein
MRWLVAVVPSGIDGATEDHYVEAQHWQAALAEARRLRGDSAPLRKCSVELTDDGFSVVDPTVGVCYEVRRSRDVLPPAVPPAPTAEPALDGGAAPGAPPETSDSTPVVAESVAARPRVLYQRPELPRPDSPIAYREVAYVVPPDTDREAIEALLSDGLADAKQAFGDRPNGRLVHLLVYDHSFEHTPLRPPLGTLVWKDWRGDPVLEIPGTDGEPISGVPADPAGPDGTSSEAIHALPAAAAEPAEPPAAPEPTPTVEVPLAPPSAEADTADRAERPSRPPPVSVRRRRSDDELISELFEAMHELRFVSDVASGAEFLLATLSRLLPAEAALVHVFDINTRHFVVVAARCAAGSRVLSYRTPDQDPFILDVMRRVGSVVHPDVAADPRLAGGRWELAGTRPRSLLCGAVRQGGRYLGLIEIANPEGEAPFHQGEVYALDYVCEQLADYLASRPLAHVSDEPSSQT